MGGKKRGWEGEKIELTNKDLNDVRTNVLNLLNLLVNPSNPRSISKQTKLRLYIWLTKIEDSAEYKAFCKLVDEQIKEFLEEWKEKVGKDLQIEGKELEDYTNKNMNLFSSYLQNKESDFIEKMMINELSGVKICKFILNEKDIPEDVTLTDLKQASRFFQYELDEA